MMNEADRLNEPNPRLSGRIAWLIGDALYPSGLETANRGVGDSSR